MIGNITRMHLRSIEKVDFFKGKSRYIKRLIHNYLANDEHIDRRIDSGIDQDGVLAIDFQFTDLTVRTSERLVYEGDAFFWEVLFYSQPATEKIKVLAIYLNTNGQFFTSYDRKLIDIDEQLEPDFFIEQLLTSPIGKEIISL